MPVMLSTLVHISIPKNVKNAHIGTIIFDDVYSRPINI
jgi:hypothetical protein